jgi:hypothetical protein
LLLSDFEQYLIISVNVSLVITVTMVMQLRNFGLYGIIIYVPFNFNGLEIGLNTQVPYPAALAPLRDHTHTGTSSQPGYLNRTW